jgi:hypothetical protein
MICGDLMETIVEQWTQVEQSQDLNMLLSTQIAQTRTQIVTVFNLHNFHGLQHDLTQKEDKILTKTP